MHACTHTQNMCPTNIVRLHNEELNQQQSSINVVFFSAA